jgi:hypothetical protein
MKLARALGNVRSFNLPSRASQINEAKMKIQVTLDLSEQSRTFELQGRLGWTMAQLADAGPRGVIPIERPAPRGSGYVHELRKRQESRIRWMHGVSPSYASLIAMLVYGEISS